MYRTSGDVRASYGSIVANLQTTVKFATANLSKPGCWAYPDMSEIGNFNGQDPLDNMRLILTNSSNVEALPGAAQDLVTKLLAPAPQDRLGFARCV